MKKRFASILSAALLAACGGPHASGVLPVATSAPGKPSSSFASFSIAVPLEQASSIKPQYVSPNTQSLSIVVTSVNGTPPAPALPTIVVPLTPSSSNCTASSGKLTCTANAIVPSGTVAFAISTYASTNATGAALSTATVTASIAAGGSTNVPVTLNGVPASLSFGTSQVSAFADGGTHTITLTVNAKDASGATIIGPGNFSTPISLAISNDSNGALVLSSATITSPSSNTVTLTYNTGVPLNSGTITATAPGATSASVDVVPIVFAPALLTPVGLVTGVTNEQFTLSEQNYSGAFTFSGGSSAITVSCSPSNCTPALSGSTVTVTIKPLSNGSGTLKISDANGATYRLPYRVSSQTAYVMASGVNPSTQVANEFEAQNSVIGPDGNIWWQSYGSSPSQPNRGWDFTQTSTSGSVVSTFAFPSDMQAGFLGMAAGPDNAIWFADDFSSIGRMSTASATLGQITEYPISIVGVTNPDPLYIVKGSDGNLWFTEQSGYLGRITTSGSIAQINLSGTPSFITSGPDGNLWVVVNNSTVDRVTTSGIVTSYALPLFTDQFGDTAPYVPRGKLIAGKDGNLWFLGYAGTGSGDSAVLCRLSTGGVFTCNPIPASVVGQTVTSEALGPDGAVWFAVQPVGTLPPTTYILRADTSFNLTYYAYPASGSNPFYAMGLVSGPDNNLWFGAPGLNEIVKFTP